VPFVLYQFGDFSLDCGKFELCRKGRRLKLERKPLELLVLLVAKHGQVVARDEIAERLWEREVFVDVEHGINTAIRKIRQILGDSSDLPQFVQTISGSGYRFIAPVTAVEPEVIEPIQPSQAPVDLPPAPPEISAAPVIPSAAKPRHRLWLVTALCVSVVIIVSILTLGPHPLATRFLDRDTHAALASLAVLPLANLSGDPNEEYFADGMTEELVTELSAIPELLVVSDSSVTPVKDNPKSLTEAARKLGVDAVIEGSVLRTKDKVSLDIRLFDARSGRQLWAGRFEDAPANISALHKHVAAEIAARARVPLTPPQQARFNSAKPLDPSAYDGYLQGRYLLSKRDIDGAVKMFRRAVVLDPSYARSWAGLAAGLADLGMDAHTTQEPIPEAKAAARHAIEIDLDNGEAWAVLGQIALNNEWDWKTAEYDLQKAIALSPSDSTIELRYATYLSIVGRNDEAVSHMRRALELDPLSFFNVRHMGSILYLTRHYDESLEYLNKAHEMEPKLQGFTQGWITRDYVMKGLYDDAVMSDLWFYSAPEASGQALRWRDRMLAAYRGGGPMAYWNAQIKLFEANDQSPCGEGGRAELYVRVGENEKALEGLKRALDAGCSGVGFTWLGADPSLDPLRGDPRFKGMLKKLNLSE
jgi:TolB-like protein/DNA-binding winged helix-turn-helix (wHTH) protein/Tfp pilus assembly protein PilF